MCAYISVYVCMYACVMYMYNFANISTIVYHTHTYIHTQQATPDELEAISSHLKSFPDTALDKPEM